MHVKENVQEPRNKAKRLNRGAEGAGKEGLDFPPQDHKRKNPPGATHLEGKLI